MGSASRYTNHRYIKELSRDFAHIYSFASAKSNNCHCSHLFCPFHHFFGCFFCGKVYFYPFQFITFESLCKRFSQQLSHMRSTCYTYGSVQRLASQQVAKFCKSSLSNVNGMRQFHKMPGPLETFLQPSHIRPYPPSFLVLISTLSFATLPSHAIKK